MLKYFCRIAMVTGFLCSLPLAGRANQTITFTDSSWTWRVITETNDLWLRSFSNNVAQFDFRIGAGGCIAEMRACYLTNQALFCPDWVNSAQPARDNVLQWVMWAGATTDGGTDEGTNWFKRWNINQAGGYDGYAPVSSVNVSATTHGCAIEIYSQNDEQFLDGYDGIFYSNQGPDWVSQCVRYDLLDEGVIKVIHSSLIPTIHRTNSVVSANTNAGNFRYAYFENWSTFLAADTNYFNGLARSLAADGSPNWWFRYNYNIPLYQWEPLTTTAGYAVAFNIGGHTNGNWPVVGVVFGKQQMVKVGNTGAEASAVMNFFEAHGAGGLGYIAILPACNQNVPVPGSIVSCETYLVPRSRSSADFVSDLNRYATNVAPPTIYAPGYANAVFANLRTNVPWGSPQNSQRVQHLAPLATGLTAVPAITNWGVFPGVFVLSGTGPEAESYRVVASTNLAPNISNWSQVGSGAFIGGVFQFSDPLATNHAQRFYQVVTP